MSDDLFQLRGRTVLVCGVANKKSVAFHVGRALTEAGANVVYTVRSEQRREELEKRLAPAPVLVMDVERDEEIDRVAEVIQRDHAPLHGLVHSIAFANYSNGAAPFHQVAREDFLQAIDISCYSFLRLAQALEGAFAPGASCVTISISTTTMAAENYGYMAPVKAALDSSVVFLAKSFAARGVRFNAVRAGLLKTSASAGIPGYLDSYLFGESATLRGKGVETREVADTALFLLSPRSSGINAQGLVVDAGMGSGYFDTDLVRRATGSSIAPTQPSVSP